MIEARPKKFYSLIRGKMAHFIKYFTFDSQELPRSYYYGGVVTNESQHCFDCLMIIEIEQGFKIIENDQSGLLVVVVTQMLLKVLGLLQIKSRCNLVFKL